MTGQVVTGKVVTGQVVTGQVVTGQVVTGVLVSELTKLRTLRSVVTCLGLTVALTVALGVIGGRAQRQGMDDGVPWVDPDTFSALDSGMGPILYGQVGLIVFGVLLVTSEFVTGMIGQSLTAVPRRGLFYAGKVAAGTAVALLVGTATVIMSFAADQAALGPYGVALTAPGAPAVLLGGVVYLTLITLIAAGLAMMLRSTVAPLVILIPLVQAGSYILARMEVTGRLAAYLPDQAGIQMFGLGNPDGPPGLGPLAGFAVMLAWAVASLAGGLLLLQRRSA